MSPAAIEQQPSYPKSDQHNHNHNRRPFAYLRSVQWRIDLGILPNPSSSSASSSSSIDHLRRVTADSRRRYASLRRRLLVDPHISKDGSTSPDLVIDNPLSQNPDSTWGRFFRNAELEKTVDQDLSRLYPEHGSYFQTPGCQGILRRILLLWCLRHPEYGYRQGMHELLAPLLYVLHVDVECLSEIRKQYEDHFTDKFDALTFHESDLKYEFDFKKVLDSMVDEIGSHGNVIKVRSLDELDPEIQTIVLLSDAYGAEGELGVVLSEKFMEHDAYCMFDALLSGAHGSVAMADFFNPSPVSGSHSGSPPVIEASAALYHLLSIVDSSLHSHLVELGVEPQYFALRWLRVLFGREFLLENLLLIWDEIFAADSNTLDKEAQGDDASSSVTCNSPQRALISSMAVSMILFLRSSLLATENATTCLQRLLNFPKNINLRKIIDKAKSLQDLAHNANKLSLSPSFFGAYECSKPKVVRGHTLSSDSISPKSALNLVPDSYWEEKWRVLHKAEELNKSNLGKQTGTLKKVWSGKVRLSLSRTESDPSPSKGGVGKGHKSSVRRNLLEDLSRELGLDEDIEKGCQDISGQQDLLSAVVMENQDVVNKDFTYRPEDRPLSGSTGSEENLSVFSYTSSPLSGANEHENDSEKSSVASNISVDDNDGQPEAVEENSSLPIADHPDAVQEDPTLIVSQPPTPVDSSLNHDGNNGPTGNTPTDLKERKFLSGKFQWFWKFGRNAGGEERLQKVIAVHEDAIPANDPSNQINKIDHPAADGSCNSCANGKGESAADQNVMGSFQNLGQSMLEHIQVIESVFQQDRLQVGSLENLSKHVLVGKGQATAMTALTELRKISNLLSEM